MAETTDLFLDFETFYGVGYSLRLNKYNTTSYIHDEQFLIHCVVILWGNETFRFYTDYDAPDPYHVMRGFFATVPWDNINMVAHNILFDGYIMHHIFNQHAATYSCTVAMSRAVFQGEITNRLEDVAPRLGFGNKLPDILESTQNKRRLTDTEMGELLTYCLQDTELCREIYYALDPYLSDSESTLMHITHDCFLKPVLELDLPRITAEHERQQKRQDDAVAATDYAASNFSSASKYKQLLENAGVKVPLKWSEKKTAFIPALAKNDLAYIELKASWEPGSKLANFATARELCASSIHTTRPLRLIEAASGNGKLPIAYNYFGAMNTGRWSGANKLNAQNFPRIYENDPLSGQCRKSIRAPKDYVLCVQDYAAIEPRTNAHLAGQLDMLQEFIAGIDQYCKLAEDIYNYPVDKTMKIERMVGKVGEIGLGYNMGWKTYQHTLAIGQFGPSVLIDEQLARLAVNTYRRKRDKVTRRWADLQIALEHMTNKGCNHTLGCLTFHHERVVLPSGRYLYYPGLRYTDQGDIVYWSARYKSWTNIYGGKLDENIVQAYSRDILGHHMIIINNEVARVVMTTHDELVTLSPETDGQATCDAMAEVMCIPPAWAVGLPLAVSGGFSREYSK